MCFPQTDCFQYYLEMDTFLLHLHLVCFGYQVYLGYWRIGSQTWLGGSNASNWVLCVLAMLGHRESACVHTCICVRKRAYMCAHTWTHTPDLEHHGNPMVLFPTFSSFFILSFWLRLAKWLPREQFHIHVLQILRCYLLISNSVNVLGNNEFSYF